MFLTAQDFNEYPYHLPDFGEHEDEFDLFADSQEREVLEKIFGSLFYNDLVAGLAVVPPGAIWVTLRDGAIYYWGQNAYMFPGLKDILKPYVYAMWLRHTWMTVTVGGPMTPQFENGDLASPRLNIVNAYNKFVRSVGFSNYSHHYRYGVYGTVFDFMTHNRQYFNHYPNWTHTDLVPMNLFDL